jgi:predicted nucleotidyltransferase
MLKKDELKILKLLLADLTKEYTITDISKSLHQKYVQTYRTIKGLRKLKNIKIGNVGNSKIVTLDFTAFNPNYVTAEIERGQDASRNRRIAVIQKQVIELNKNAVCILFGSQVTKPSSGSDIDILFVVSEEENYSAFERKAKRQLSPYNCDINIVTEEGLLKMWSTSQQFNVGNEILKNHIVLYGAEHFCNLLRRHHVG